MQAPGTKTQQTKEPWQLETFQRSLKKQLKLQALLEATGDLSGKECLLVTCGDNNGALNWYIRAQGGNWTWADVSGENLEQISGLLDDPVLHLPEDEFPLPDDQYDCVVSIDVLEHLEHDQTFLYELYRVLKPGGLAVITVPNGDAILLANRIKWRVGMTPEVYGHTRAGYNLDELRQAVSQAGLTPVGEGGYSRFFTEMVELVINYVYVFVLSRRDGDVELGHIAPTSSGELKTHGAAYRLYSFFFPLMRLVSRLDKILPATSNNAVIVTATKKTE